MAGPWTPVTNHHRLERHFRREASTRTGLFSWARMDHMGIRIHKVMGFGIADLQLDEEGNAITDPRVNVGEDGERLWELKLTGYRDWIKAQTAAFEAAGGERSGSQWAGSDLIYMHGREEKLEKERASDYVTLLNGYDGEDYNGKGVLLIRPYGMDDWTHYADPIDYAEDDLWQQDHFGTYEGPQTRVQELPNAPWPHDVGWWDAETGKPTNHESWRFVRSMLSMKKQTPDHQRAIEKISQELGYTGYAEAAERLKPMLPSSFINFLDWCGVLPNRDDYRMLRPMLLTYWS